MPLENRGIIYDADGDSPAVMPANTSPATSDPALVVILSPNGSSPGGSLANGAVGNPNPVIVGGRDGANVRTLLTDSTGQLKVVVSQPTTAISITLAYDQSVAVAGAQANAFFNALTYTVPASYKLVMAQFNSYSADNRVTARVSKYVSAGTWNIGTQVFTAGSAYTTPAFASYLEAEVTTVTGGSNNVTLTITYTNQDGTSGRTGTCTVPKNTPVGYKLPVVLQSGDYGVVSVQSIAQVSTNTGIVQLKAGVEFYNQAMTTAGQSYLFAPPAGAQIVAAGEVVELAWESNAAATSERIIKVAGVLQSA